VSELNPNHKVTQQARDQWHKIAALIMINQGIDKVSISHEDVEKLSAGNINIAIDARFESATGNCIIRLVDDATAAKMAASEGGRLKDN
jgi:hypothetical protein